MQTNTKRKKKDTYGHIKPKEIYVNHNDITITIIMNKQLYIKATLHSNSDLMTLSKF